MMKGIVEDPTYLINEARRDLGLSNVTGGPGLHGTQRYPKAYGQAVAKSWEAWHVRKPSTVRSTDLDQSESSDEELLPTVDRWPDCDLVAVRDLLKVLEDRCVV